MTSTDIERGAAWAAASTLAERLAALRAADPSLPPHDVDLERARRRLQRWRVQTPFASDAVFARRLAADGITEDELLRLLGEKPEAVRDRARATPDWLRHFGAAFGERPGGQETRPLLKFERGQSGSGFLLAVEPLLSYGAARFLEGVERLAREYESLPFDPRAMLDMLAPTMLTQTLGMLNRTMILELNVARLQGQLEGETPEARFASFLRRLGQRETALALLEEYPALARQVTVRVEHWLDAGLEFLRRLCADWDAIRDEFGARAEVGLLSEIKGSAGDLHRGGRSVLIAKFSSGFRLVYKPKSLAVDVHLQQLLDWLNRRGTHPPFRTLKVIDRGDYGWVEFVEARPCDSAEEVERFYRRQGGYLALLYLLQATDFHFENLIAAGEHPVLIDLESLFHPRLENSEPIESQQLAGEDMNSSVLRVGLLPQRVWFGPEGDGLDLSGLGAAGGQLAPIVTPSWEQAGTDEMHVVRTRGMMPAGQNRPSLGGADINLLDYGEAVVGGFTSIYRTLLRHREELLADGGPLAAFARDEVRVILRPTKNYAQLLFESYHPDLLRDGLDRDRYFDRLWVPVEQQPHLARVIPAELRDLGRGDIPMFTTRPDSRDLLTSSHEVIPDFSEETGMALVRRRIEQMSEDDLTRQLWFIRASFTSLSLDSSRPTRPAYQLSESREAPERGQFLAEARAVGDRLEQLALCGERDASWVGLTLVNERHWSLMPMGADLYSGVPGVALFLSYLGELTREERYTALAMKAWQTVRRQAERLKSASVSVGGFSGWGGLLYTLTHLSALWRQPALLAEAEEIVELLSHEVERDEDYDIIGGSAGCLAALLCLHRHAPATRALPVAVRYGEHLLAHARQMESGLGWTTRVAPESPLAGFSHGAAGIAWALLQLEAQAGGGRFGEAARAAMNYERTLYSPAARNWPDLRAVNTQPPSGDGKTQPFMCAWCHGAAGIGLGRLNSLAHVDDAEIRAEIATALETTLAQGFGMNHSLCHGDLGNLELLQQAAGVLADPQLQARFESLSAGVLASIKNHGWLCGVPSGVETPGLMNGLAGIGYGLLRLAEPARVPSVLVLAPPAPGL